MLCFFACKSPVVVETSEQVEEPVASKKAEILVFDKFEDFNNHFLSYHENDTTYIVNFWATWCRPCVQELPIFDSVLLAHPDAKIKMVLVSLDQVDSLKNPVKPFVAKKGIQADVAVLTDSKTNQWIDLVDSNWSGSIPFTVISKGKQRFYYEKQYHSKAELLADIYATEQLKSNKTVKIPK